MAYRAGDVSPEAGVYRCANCRAEVNLTVGETLPPCDCGQGDWSLVQPAWSGELRP